MGTNLRPRSVKALRGTFNLFQAAIGPDKAIVSVTHDAIEAWQIRILGAVRAGAVG